jgi:hypothetical protein
MTVERRTLGIFPKSGTVSTRELSCLRYDCSGTGLGFGIDDLNKVEIVREGKARMIALGVKDSEAYALIDLMMEVYTFPEEPAAIKNASATSN